MKDALCKKLNRCRICKNRDLKKIIELGSTPPANAFLTKRQLNQEEYFFPLDVAFCSKCGQLQLTHVVSPKLLFKNYVYVSSTSPVFVKHFEDYAKDVLKQFKFKKSSLIVDLGSNDGILLKPFKKFGMKVLGIDPAVKIAKEATKNGVETIPDFFSPQLAKKIFKKYGYASVITANNVFAHINDIDSVAGGIKILLDKEGIFIVEAPYLIDFLQKNLFDLIYHEHLSYYSVRPLSIFFQRHGMKIIDVKKVNSHGGSIRVFVSKKESNHKVKQSVKKFLDKEKKLKLNKINTYHEFAKKIEQNKLPLIKLLNRIKSQKKVIVGYGAPAKGNTLLNYFNIQTDTLDYIVDDSPYKQGLFTPGTHIPVVSSEKINQTKPDYILILAWNFAEPIMQKLSAFKNSGGLFIIPVPKPKIV